MIPFPIVIIRTTIPSRYDHAPLATICQTEDGQYYIQSTDEDEPDWRQCASQEHAFETRKSLLANDPIKNTKGLF